MRPYVKLLRYPFAIAVALLAVALRMALQPWLGESAPLIALLLAPIAAALYGGLGPGLVATAVAGALGVAAFVSPNGLPLPPTLAEAVRLLLFLAIGAAISAVIAGRSAALARLGAEHRRLEQAREEMAARERRIGEILEAAPSAMLLLDTDGRVEFANGTAERLFGYPREDLAKLAIEALIPERFRPAHGGHRESFQRAPVTRPMGAGRDLYALRRDGTEVPVEIGLNHLASAEGPKILVSVTDITQRKRAEAALRTSEERYALAARATYNAIWDWDLATDALEWNDGVNEVFGYARGAVPAGVRWWYDTLHPDDRDRVVASIRAAIDGPADAGAVGRTWQEEYRFRRADGSYARVVDRGFIARDAGGRALRMIGAMSDVTAEREAVTQLERREAHLAALYRQTGAALAEADLGGRLVAANDRFCEMVGRSLDEVRRLTVREVTHPDDWAANERELRRLVATGEPFSMEKRYLRPDGAAVWVANSVTIVRTPGVEDRVVAVSIDVSARKAVEARLRESEARFRAAVEAASDILWTADAEGQMRGEQAGWAAFTGQRAEEYGGLGWIDAVHRDDAAATLSAWRHAVAAGTRYAVEHRVRRHDGAWRTFAARALPLRDAAGNIREWVGVHTDTTDVRAAETALRAADQRKDEFLATLAHELRNPLAPLGNSLAILARTDDPRTAKQLRDMMGRQLAQLVRLVDDLLEVSRITTGKLRLHRETVRLADALGSAFEAARPLVDAHHHRLVLEGLDPAQIRLEGDPVRLAQVFINLLNNAAKYSDPGGTITVRVARPRDGWVCVGVRDTGIGIDGASLPHVFDLFTQVDRGRDRAQGGLGIGLSLARRLVEMHGGAITAHSDGPGRGANFVVELPATVEASAEPPGLAAQPARDDSKCHVVVADDNRDAADSLAMMLRLGGHEVQTAYDGREALHAVRAHRPHVAILDIGMPEYDGYGVARLLRQEPWGRSLVLVALTGWGQDADKKRTAAAGFDHHFTKPVDPDRIEAVLAALPHCRREKGSDPVFHGADGVRRMENGV